MDRVAISLREWEEVLPQRDNGLYQYFLEDPASREVAKMLTSKGILKITELREGLRISANSYVGKINLGSLRISIGPKIDGMPLYRLLKYTYGLRDLKIFDQAIHDIDHFPFFDLLIYQLQAEAEELLARGLNRRYKRTATDLASPRGRIDFSRLSAQIPLAKTTLPCSYFERSEDNGLNRVLLAGLRLALNLTDDINLRLSLGPLVKGLEERVSRIELSRAILAQTLKGMDRLSENYRPALELVNILFESQGIQLEDGTVEMRLKGFFFDMNKFFQSLLAKLLEDYLKDYRVQDEYTLHGLFSYTPGFNPRGRYAPKPRPDFAVLKGRRVEALLDAKYRDLWEQRLPREMLYQLSIYALSGLGTNTARIIYPSLATAATLQRIDIKNPTTGDKYGEVVLKPVSLIKLAQLLDLPYQKEARLSEYINELVFG